LLEAALAVGADVLSVTQSRVSLERIFLEAVERGEHAEDSADANGKEMA
jgi:hypothetical protein